MPKDYNAHALVIKKTKLKETDLIVTMLAGDGHQIRAVVHGCRRPGSKFGARFELACELDLLLRKGRNLDVVAEAQTLQMHGSARSSVESMAAVDIILEALEKVSRDAPVSERVYVMSQAVLSMLDALQQDKETYSLFAPACALSAAYLWKLACMLGVAPQLDSCVNCGKTLKRAECLSISGGGVLCSSCCSSLPTQTKLIEHIKYLINSKFSLIMQHPAHGAQELEAVHIACLWLFEHLQIRLRSYRFLATLL